MRILVTNDDGIHSLGIAELAKALAAIGEVWIVAPDRERTAVGHGVTLHKPLRIHQLRPRTYAVNGTPVDCVNLALLKVMPKPPALVVSGINIGANLGHDVTYSGTVTAAMEAVIAGLPGVAVSLEIPEGHIGFVDFKPAALASGIAVRNVLEHGLPADTLLNINVPFLSQKDIQGFRMTRQGLRVYHSRLDERVDPRGRPYYWIGGEAPTGVAEDGTDFGALAEGYVSITPLQLDLTHYKAMDVLRKWEF